jgi:DNA-binding GntR family transcriptional regulator
VREALRHLEQEGLVTAGHRGMLRVNLLSPSQVRGLYRVRAALEGLAVTTIIESPTRDDAVAVLRRALDRLAGAGGDFAERLEADLGFHLLLCELADNPMLVESWRHLEGRIRVAVMSHSSDQLPGIMSRDRHAPIVDAIEAGDAAAARAVLEEHMAGAAEVYAPS